MTAVPFGTPQEKLIETEIRRWSANVLEKKNKAFNNLPACPYAQAAWDKDKVGIVFKYDKDYQSLYSLISTFDDRYDLVILVDTAYDDYEKFHEYIEQLNDAISQGFFIDKDIWLMGFHPEGDENDNLEGESFEPLVEEEYGLIFVQRLTKLQESAEKIKKLGYYDCYKDEYNSDEIYQKRELFYRRLKNGNESS